MKRFPTVLAVAATSLVTVSGAFAQETGGVEINGFASNTAGANGDANVAAGVDTRARQQIGTIDRYRHEDDENKLC